MISALILTVRKLFEAVAYEEPKSSSPLQLIFQSPRAYPITPPLTNFHGEGSFHYINDGDFFMGIFYDLPAGQNSNVTSSIKCFAIKNNTSTCSFRRLFQFFRGVHLRSPPVVKRAVQTIPYNGSSILVIERMGDENLVSLYKIRSNRVKRVKTVYRSLNAESMLVLLKAVFIPKENMVVIADFDRFVIYDLKRQYNVHQHFVVADRILDVAYSEALGLVFICYSKTIVAYEWQIPFKIGLIAYTIDLDAKIDLPRNMEVSGNYLILQVERCLAWRIHKKSYERVSTHTDIESFREEIQIMDVAPETRSIVFIDKEAKLYEYSLEDQTISKCSKEDFYGLTIPYDHKNNQLLLKHKGEYVIVRAEEAK